MRIVVTGAIAIAALACVARQTHVAGGATSCAATTVRYPPTAIGIPHVDAGALKGHLFYYAGPTLMDGPRLSLRRRRPLTGVAYHRR